MRFEPPFWRYLQQLVAYMVGGESVPLKHSPDEPVKALRLQYRQFGEKENINWKFPTFGVGIEPP